MEVSEPRRERALQNVPAARACSIEAPSIEAVIKFAATLSRGSSLLRTALGPVLPRFVTVQRLVRAALLPAIVALPALFFVMDGTNRASLTALGRDQGIFQYIAWAIEHGAVDYRDVRDVNGPLVHLVHFVFLKLGGDDEHRFRFLDLLCSGVAFSLFGACLPGLGSSPARRGSFVRPAMLVSRVLWGLAGWVILSAQYLSFLSWDLAQRESFCNWFVLASIGFALVGQRSWRSEMPRDRALGDVLVFASAACSCIAPLGKPTYVLFPIVQLLTLLVDDLPRVTRKRRFLIFAIGGAAGALIPLGFLFRYGDAAAFFRITLVDVPTMYRFIWPRTAVEIFGQFPHFGLVCAIALVTALVMLGLLIERQIPRRALAVILFPLVGIASMLAQKKGFPYHFHPVTAGLYAQWLLLVCWFGERFRSSPRRRILQRMVPLIAGAALAMEVVGALQSSPHLGNLWILDKGRDGKSRESAEYLVYFQTNDYFPIEMRQTAEWLRAHTASDDRVQIYGMDPYLLFLAQRLSASPYIYSYDLNADAALAGDEFPDGLHPNGAQMYAINELRKKHELDLMERLKKAPPAAFVFMDKAPLISWPDAHQDLAEHDPVVAPWVDANYAEAARFGTFHVWTRRTGSTSPTQSE